MTTRARLDDRDMAHLAEVFALGRVRSWALVPAGTINTTFRVECDRGRFAIRVHQGKTVDDIRYEAELVGALADADIPAPRPLASAAGQLHVELREHRISAFPWAPGRHVSGDAVAPAHARAIGVALGRLHLAGRPLTERFARTSRYSFADICARLERIRAGVAGGGGDPVLAPALATLAEERAWLEPRGDIRARAPVGVIHGDLFGENVLFDGSRITALLDFEQASTGSLAYDLAVSVNAWCVRDGEVASGAGHRVEGALVQALLGGYRDTVGDPALAALTPALPIELRAAAMRFTVTRITDIYLPGVDKPGKDFRHFLRRLHDFRRLSVEDLLPAPR